MCVLTLLMAPSMVIRYNMGWYEMLLIDVPLFFAATASVANFYMVCQRELYPRTWTERLRYLPFLMSIGIGLAVNNTKAVIEALLHRPSEFARTPKYHIEGGGDEWMGKKYRQAVAIQPLIELALGLYFTATLFYALANGIYGTVPFLMLFQIGFLYTGLLSIVQQYGGDLDFKPVASKRGGIASWRSVGSRPSVSRCAASPSTTSTRWPGCTPIRWSRATSAGSRIAPPPKRRCARGSSTTTSSTQASASGRRLSGRPARWPASTSSTTSRARPSCRSAMHCSPTSGAEATPPRWTALLHYGYGTLRLPQINAITDLGNTASQHVLLKAGLVRTANARSPIRRTRRRARWPGSRATARPGWRRSADPVIDRHRLPGLVIGRIPLPLACRRCHKLANPNPREDSLCVPDRDLRS